MSRRKTHQPAERFAARRKRSDAAARFRGIRHSRADAVKRHSLAQSGTKKIRARDRAVSRFRDEFVKAQQLLVCIVLPITGNAVRSDFVACRIKCYERSTRTRNADVRCRGEKLRADEPRAAVAFRSRSIVGVAAQIRHQRNRSAERAVRAIDGDVFRSRRECAGVLRKIKIERCRIIVADRSRGKLARGNEKRGGSNGRGKHKRTTRQRGDRGRVHRC